MFSLTAVEPAAVEPAAVEPAGLQKKILSILVAVHQCSQMHANQQSTFESTVDFRVRMLTVHVFLK